MGAVERDRPIQITRDSWIKTNVPTLLLAAAVLVWAVNDRRNIIDGQAELRRDVAETRDDMQILARCTIEYQRVWFADKGIPIPPSLADSLAVFERRSGRRTGKGE